MSNYGSRYAGLALGLGVLLSTGCDDSAPSVDRSGESASSNGTPAEIAHGREVWFENTYGGEKFFAMLAQHPDPQRRIRIAFYEAATTPRQERFARFGVLNDPDCVENPAGGMDICSDPEASGIVGVRKKTMPDGTVLFGAACASCHAGFDPVNPPVDPAEPTWDNIHPTIGNQYLKTGELFAANLAPTDPRRLIFSAWPDGTVDTTLLFDDHIMNPGVITAFWEHKRRNTFDVGLDEGKLRNGQGGEDDVGGDLAAIRVYTNIGVCFQECVAPAMATGTEIDLESCRQSCPDFPPQRDLDDMSAFLGSIEAPHYPGKPTDQSRYLRGRNVFEAECTACHANDGELRFVLSDDEMEFLGDDPANDTNACRALTTNWEEGKLWGQFASQAYRDRAAAGDKGYRHMPLSGIWSTSPFLHNQSIGVWAPADATPAERAEAFRTSMWELLQPTRTPEVNRLPFPLPTASGTLPAGTPLAYLFSRAPNGSLLCSDVVENRGHHYGAGLSDADKEALIYWLQFQ